MVVKFGMRWQPFLLGGIALCGLVLRLYGLNWDQGQNLHFDEGTVVEHAFSLGWPTSLMQFLDPVNSPLNPHFFAYGSFPMYLLALVGHLVLHGQANTFENFHIVGRILSALFDSGTILLTACIGWRLTKDRGGGRPHAWNVALLAAVLVAFTPAQLQNSHYYTVDVTLVFFVTLTLLASVALVTTEKPVRWLLIAGLGYGLAIATKFSASPLAVLLCLAILLRWYRRRDTWSALSSLSLLGNIALVVFMIAMPYALLDMHTFIDDVSLQGNMVMHGVPFYNFIWEFVGTTPFLFQGREILLWGMGVTLALAALGGLLWQLWYVYAHRTSSWVVVLAWVLLYGGMLGNAYVKPMRYMLPIYSSLILMAASALVCQLRSQWKIRFAASEGVQEDEQVQEVQYAQVGGRSQEVGRVQEAISGTVSRQVLPQTMASIVSTRRHSTSKAPDDGSAWSGEESLGIGQKVVARKSLAGRWLGIGLIGVVLAGTIFQGLAMVNIYSQPNTRIQASRWMYSHLKAGSVITYQWFDVPALPLAIDGHDPTTFVQASYKDSDGHVLTGLSPYSHETKAKAHLLASILHKIDAIAIGSESVGVDLRSQAAAYPLDLHFYQLLVHGQLGLHLAAQFEDHPHLLGITLDESGADLGLSIFDHPVSRVFVRDTPYPYTEDQLFHKLADPIKDLK